MQVQRFRQQKESVHSSVQGEVDGILNGKSYDELEKLHKQISTRLQVERRLY